MEQNKMYTIVYTGCRDDSEDVVTYTLGQRYLTEEAAANFLKPLCDDIVCDTFYCIDPTRLGVIDNGYDLTSCFATIEEV